MVGRLLCLAGVLLILGAIGICSGALGFSWGGPDFEMPLGDLRGVAVDSSGNIYCAGQFHSRVQKYDPEGRFLFGFQVDTRKAFRIRVNENDELEVATTGQFFRFSPEGKRLEKEDNVHAYVAFRPYGERSCRGPDNSVYRIRRPIIFPSVVRISPSGQKSTVVSVPFHKWLIMAPFPAFFFMASAMLLVIGMEYFVRRKREKRREEMAKAAKSAESGDDREDGCTGSAPALGP